MRPGIGAPVEADDERTVLGDIVTDVSYERMVAEKSLVLASAPPLVNGAAPPPSVRERSRRRCRASGSTRCWAKCSGRRRS